MLGATYAYLLTDLRTHSYLLTYLLAYLRTYVLTYALTYYDEERSPSMRSERPPPPTSPVGSPSLVRAASVTIHIVLSQSFSVTATLLAGSSWPTRWPYYFTYCGTCEDTRVVLRSTKRLTILVTTYYRWRGRSARGVSQPCHSGEMIARLMARRAH